MEKKKIWKLGGIFLLVLLLAGYMDSKEGELKEGSMIERNSAGEGEKDVVLEIQAEGLDTNLVYELEVPEALFTEEEANACMEQAISEIEEDFMEITDVVPIKKSYQSGLVEATWRFDEADCMDLEGNIVKELVPEEGMVINAEVYLKCQNYERIYCFPFSVPKQELSEEEKLLSGISNYIETKVQEEGENQIELPTEINGISLVWKEKKEHLVIKILFLEILVVILLVVSEREKKKEIEKRRRESMELDYPEIVGQITLLLGAGMTISQAWNKIAVRYLEKRKKGIVAERPAFEELVYVNRRMQEGESEREALTLLGKRISLMSYHRFIRIILNNKRKGGDGLCRDLEQETAQAYDERILIAKQKGEEASTKMLLPLMLMMILVMAIVLLPALLEISG